MLPQPCTPRSPVPSSNGATHANPVPLASPISSHLSVTGHPQVCRQIGAASAQTVVDANNLLCRSAVAQAAGVEGVVASVLLSCKLNEVHARVPGRERGHGRVHADC